MYPTRLPTNAPKPDKQASRHQIDNILTNPQDLCKLEIMRLDKKFEWYEVRSSMRLAWLMTKQMIIPVEVICSFQQMHRDSPAGNANSIVARLQKVSVCKGASKDERA